MKLLTVFAALLVSTALLADSIVIISPHRKSIQREFIPKFKAYYKTKFKKDVTVDWLDQGGTSDDLRFVRAKFVSNPKTSGIDIFWGGGLATFLELKQRKYLSSYKVSKSLLSEIPATAAGIPMYDKSYTWYSAAMSSFGIFYNRKIQKMMRLPDPIRWEDLASDKYFDQLTLTDPRRSGTAKTMNMIVLESMGWEKGFTLLSAIAGNTRTFTHSSSDPIKAVESGDAVAAMAIDFYAAPKIAKLGKENLGFNLPKGQTILDPDPIAILKGAPNRKVAERFIEFVLSADAQKLLVLPVGKPGGPKHSVLGRMACNQKTYQETEGQRLTEANPFKMPAFLKMDMDKMARVQTVLVDLLGAVHIDTHRELKKAWKMVLKSGRDPKKIAAFGKPPVTEKELEEVAKKWGDEVYRNKMINKWTKEAKAKYTAIAKGNS